MTKIYACLLGKWECLNDDESCVMGENRTDPGKWYEENAPIWAPIERTKKDSFYQLDYVHISFKGRDYRINPVFIQIVRD